MLRFQEFARIDKAVSAQLTVQFVHVGARVKDLFITMSIACVKRDEFASVSR